MNEKPKKSNSRDIDTLRDHLANERTFLAWVRTGLGLMVFGFVVEKFSLFFKEAYGFLDKSKSINIPIGQNLGSYAFIGIVLVAVGAILSILAFFKYKMVEKQIETDTYRPSIILDGMLIIIVLFIAIFLVFYLIRSLST